MKYCSPYRLTWYLRPETEGYRGSRMGSQVFATNYRVGDEREAVTAFWSGDYPDHVYLNCMSGAIIVRYQLR